MRYWLLQYRAIVVVFCLTGVCPDTQATAQNSLLKQHRADTLVIHQQRQEALKQQLTPVAPDIHLSLPVSSCLFFRQDLLPFRVSLFSHCACCTDGLRQITALVTITTSCRSGQGTLCGKAGD